MRRTLLVGAVLAVAAALVVLLSDLLDLKLESVALLGVAAGAVVALVPDAGPVARLGGFLGGFVAAWVGYLLRAAVLPDSTGGRAVTVLIVLALCVAVVAVALGRVPLWATLLGAASMAGAYEYTFAAAPPEVATTSVSTATSLLVASALGFLLTALLAPQPAVGRGPREARAGRPAQHNDPTALDDMMEKSK